MGYNVVFEGTGKTDSLTGEPLSNYEGIRTWTTYSSEEEFERWWANDPQESIIVAQGVTDEEAVALVKQTSGRARALAALRSSAGFGVEYTMHQLQMGFFAAVQEGHKDEYLATLGEMGIRVQVE